MSITKHEIKEVTDLNRRKGRRQTGRYVAEGIRLLEEAVNFGVAPEVVYVAEALLSSRGERVSAELAAMGAELKTGSAKTLEAMADTTSSQGIVAVFAQRWSDWQQLRPDPARRVLWCAGISDPGNMGTLLRSAAAFGFRNVVIGEGTVDVYAPKVVRSSAGALFALSLFMGTTAEIGSHLAAVGLPVLAADMTGRSLRELPAIVTAKPLALVVGAEADGIPEDAARYATEKIRVDHDRCIESLNAGVAGSILMSRLYNALHEVRTSH